MNLTVRSRSQLVGAVLSVCLVAVVLAPSGADAASDFGTNIALPIPPEFAFGIPTGMAVSGERIRIVWWGQAPSNSTIHWGYSSSEDGGRSFKSSASPYQESLLAGDRIHVVALANASFVYGWRSASTSSLALAIETAVGSWEGPYAPLPDLIYPDFDMAVSAGGLLVASATRNPEGWSMEVSEISLSNLTLVSQSAPGGQEIFSHKSSPRIQAGGPDAFLVWIQSMPPEHPANVMFSHSPSRGVWTSALNVSGDDVGARPSVAGASNGSVIVTYEAGYRIRLASAVAPYDVFQAPVDIGVPAEGNEDSDATDAVDAGGNFHAAWLEKSSGAQPQPRYAIEYAESVGPELSFQVPFQVDDDPAGAAKYAPVLIDSSGGGTYMTWGDGRAGNGSVVPYFTRSISSVGGQPPNWLLWTIIVAVAGLIVTATAFAAWYVRRRRRRQ